MGEACSTHGYMSDPGADGRLILRRICELN
jgi:hypothetical protein